MNFLPLYLHGDILTFIPVIFRDKNGDIFSPDNTRALNNRLTEIRFHCLHLTDVRGSESSSPVGQTFI
jgi:hypothetical protein